MNKHVPSQAQHNKTWQLTARQHGPQAGSFLQLESGSRAAAEDQRYVASLGEWNFMRHTWKIPFTFLTLAVTILCADPNSQAQSAPGWARLKRVQYVRSETKRDRALEKAILQSLPNYSEEIRRIHEYDPSVVPTYLIRYFYNRVDLNDDGKSETLVWLHSAMVGGSSGYTAQIYRSGKEGYRLLWEATPVWNPVIVSGRKTREWRNLIMLVAGGGVRPGYWIEVSFNGESYPSSSREGVEIRKSRIGGRAFIADEPPFLRWGHVLAQQAMIHKALTCPKPAFAKCDLLLLRTLTGKLFAV